MEPFRTVRSRMIPLLSDDIDTDQIIPARFLKVVSKRGLGVNLFADWRYHADGSPLPDFVLNQAKHADRSILLAGDNFGCGSSREHAPWALADWGIRVVISTSFADIFANNAMSNGILPLVVTAEVHATLVAAHSGAQGDAGSEPELAIDLERHELTLSSGQVVQFPIDGFAQSCLLSGTDKLGYVLSFGDAIGAYEAVREDSDV